MSIEGSSLFVPPDEIDAYCQKNHIERRQLPNGITLLGSTQHIDNLNAAEIKYMFPQGSYFDPPGKTGIHHLFEHLVSYKALRAARRNDVEYNATTAPAELYIDMAGASNANHPNYGVWPLLPIVASQITRPIETMGDVEKFLDKERGVILGEIMEFKADHNRVISNIWISI